MIRPTKGGDVEPNAQNQLVMRNYNVHAHVLDLLLGTPEAGLGSPRVYVGALRLLSAMCLKSADGQKVFRGLVASPSASLSCPPSGHSLRCFSSLTDRIFLLSSTASLQWQIASRPNLTGPKSARNSPR